MYRFDYAFLLHEIWVAVSYVPLTLMLASVPVAFGLIFGSLLAIIRIHRVPVLHEIVRAYVVLVRGMPMVLVMLILYFSFVYGFDALAEALGWSLRSGKIPDLVFALVVLSFLAVAFMSESIHTALQSVPPGQIEAAQSIGMTAPAIYRRVIIPQALPVAIPILGNTLIGQAKGTALVYMIGVTDLITGVKIEANATYRYLEAYIACALIYWALCVGIEQGVRLLNAKVRTHYKEVAA
ncbi:MAG: amino acid ABC transporter permease [Treponema sp.]|jgi:ABC-type amino acid transport system permease subunit|nr:amino acid ABC transporter permease [Treponema sp.]